MPRLLLFAPCSKVIVSADDQTVTLVALVDGVNAPQGATVADLTWERLSVWQAEPGDEGRRFEERLEIVRPDRRVAAEVRQPFVMESRTLRVRGSVVGFPCEIEGDYVLRLSVRDAVAEDAWERLMEYPVTVRHITAQAPEDPPTPESSPLP
jgi:hypothetical protein